MASRHTVSVVISTLNRAALLRNSLHSLRYQNFPEFEVVVVNGPSTDDTESLLREYEGQITVGRISEANLSKSRNVGIDLARGSLILFLDDDAYPEPDWIGTIVSGYDSERVGGVGTRVYDHSGFQWQTNPFTVDQYYKADFKRRPPVWAFEFADSLTIPHILGASSSFRRDLLMRIGGFDEEIEYFLDESEVCRRIAETEHVIRFLDHGAAVHHKFASGVVRDERRILTYPYPVVKNKFYVSLSDCLRHGRDLQKCLDHCESFVEELLQGARWQLAHMGISQLEFDRFVADVRRGREDGLARAGAHARKSHAIVAPPADRPAVAFPTQQPQGGRLTLCFISRWLPSLSPGGVARFMYDLASGMAARGHDVHLITMREGPPEVEYESGLWIHGLSAASVREAAERMAGAETEPALQLRSGAARTNTAWSQAAHDEVLRLRAERYIDLVVAPAWDQEGLHCVLDPQLRTVISMNTTFKTYAEIERNIIDADTHRELLALERLYITRAPTIHANSAATARHVEQAFGRSSVPRWMVIGHGCRDADRASLQRASRHREGGDRPPRLLYVSRLERRKGTDLFLAALPGLLAAQPAVEVHVVGRDSYADDPARSLTASFRKKWPSLRDRVVFRGEVNDEELAREFEQADVFCVPSRYESFGIIYLEAMRYSLPVVATEVGGIPDIVIDGETGLLVPPDNIAALTAALARLMGDAALRRRMAKSARARFEQDFEHEVIVDKTLAAFGRLCDAATAAEA
jgi:glycogen(starch) synthase